MPGKNDAPAAAPASAPAAPAAPANPPAPAAPAPASAAQAQAKADPAKPAAAPAKATPTEQQAGKKPETPAEQPAGEKPAEPAADPAKAKAEEDAKFQKLAGRERALIKREAEVKRLETAVKQKDAELKALPTKADFIANPEAAFAKLGLDPRAVIKAFATWKPPTEAEKAKADLDVERKKLEDEKKALEEKSNEEKANQRVAWVQARKVEISGKIAEKPDDYELLTQYGEDVIDERGRPVTLTGADVVWGMMDAHYQAVRAEYLDAKDAGATEAELQEIEKRAILSMDAAIPAAEKFLEEEARKTVARIGRSKKLGLAAPAPAAEAPAAAPPVGTTPGSAPVGTRRSPTLGNDAAPMSATAASGTAKPYSRMSKAERAADDERRRRNVDAMAKK